jgi:cupredoxin-like protein
MVITSISGKARLLIIVSLAMLCLVAPSHAQQAKEIEITYKGKQFQPSEIAAPANTALTLRIKNLDGQPMEFESKSLRVEKVITGNGEGLINIRPLQPGRYEFFDDFNDKSRGSLNVR